MSQVSVANMFTAAKRGRARTKLGKSEKETPEISISEPETILKRTLRGSGSGTVEIPVGVLALPSRTRSSRSKTPEDSTDAADKPAKTRSSRNKTSQNTPANVDVPAKSRPSRNKAPENTSGSTYVPGNKTPENADVLLNTRSSRPSRSKTSDLSPASLDVPDHRKNSNPSTINSKNLEKSKSTKVKQTKSQEEKSDVSEEVDETMDTVDDGIIDDPVDCLTSQFETIEIKETVKQLHPSPKLVPSRTTRRWKQKENNEDQQNSQNQHQIHQNGQNQDQIHQNGQNQHQIHQNSRDQHPLPLKSPVSCPPTDHEVEIVTAQTIVTAVSQAEELSRKLTPVEVKEKLSKVGKLADLKVALTGINKASTRSTRTTRRNKLQEPVPIDVTEEKEEKKKEVEKEVSPSYERFHTLSQAVDGSLPLPYSYKLLGDVFRCTDTVMGMLHNRREIVTLEKIKKAVQEMLKKDFKETFLKQIKWVFPAGYKYFWEKEMGKFGARKNEYELHVAVNTDYKKDMQEDRPLDNQVKTFVKLGPNMMVERRRIVENSLLDSVKKHHESFCSSLHPPIIVDEAKLLKWHRDFDVDACPAIPEDEFPPKPNVEKLLTAKQVLEKAEQLFNLNPRLSEALVKVADTVEEVQKVPEPPKEVKVDPIPKHLKGLNPKLIEKIRAKEAAKAKLESTTDTGAVQKVARYRRLPGLARLIRNVFISEQKAALPMQLVARKASECHPGRLTAKDIEEDIQEMVKVVAPWPTLHVVREITYLKINNNMDINGVVAKLDNLKNLAEQGKLNN